MKFSAKTPLLLIIILACVIIASAQMPPPPPGPKTKVIGKAKIYEFKTKTKAESVFLNRNDKQRIHATFEVPAEQAGAKPKGVLFFYRSFSDNGFKHKEDDKFAIFLNDK